MATQYYRLICDVNERNQVVSERVIRSTNYRTNHETWFTPTRYNDPFVAQRELALPMPVLPMYRVGPIPEDEISHLTVGPRRVAPAFGHPGGGIEIATKNPVYLFGLWSFVNSAYDSSI